MKTLYLTKHQQININEIMYLQGDSNYTYIHTKDKQTTVASQTLHLIHSSINYASFVRINRKHILNIAYISDYSFENNVLTLNLFNGEKFTASRRRIKSSLDKIFKKESGN